MIWFFFLSAGLVSCSQTATLEIDDAGTIPVDYYVDSGELEDTAG